MGTWLYPHTTRYVWLVHTIALNFEDPLIFDAPVIRGHMAFMCHLPYLLFVHIGEFFTNGFSPFFAKIFIEMILGLVECLGLFKCWLGVVGYHG